MATGKVDRNGMGIARGSCGKATGDGTALSITLGFKPKHIVIANVTDATRWEWIDGMAANISFKTVTAGTLTADNTGAITIAEKGFIVSAAAAADGKALVWFAE